MFKNHTLSYLVVLFCAISVQLQNEQVYAQEIHKLPDDLTTLQSEDLDPIIPLLGDAKIIGVTECVHDMIEPFHFRNTLIKKLVESKRISVIAIESGFPESRLAYDYILGKDIDLDSVAEHGFSCIFGSIDANKELLVWLRDYNMDKEESEQVHFYGFDIPGCPPNPVLENAMAGFDYVFQYLDQVDKKASKKFREAMSEYQIFMRIKDGESDTLQHFWDLDTAGWDQIELILDKMETKFEQQSKKYISKSSELDYNWAFRSIINARENVIFLRNIGKSTINYDSRDYGQFKNIEWIVETELNKNILLFAHSTHLMKEVHSDSPSVIPFPRCGEYLAEAYGNQYKVIGNFYRKLDWFDDDPIELEDGHLGFELSKYGISNFFLDVTTLDSSWNKVWCVRSTNSGNKLFIDLAKSVDIIYFNDTQTTLFVPEE